MAAGTHNITIEQGATFEYPLVWVDSNANARDLTGYTARMHLRATLDAAAFLLELTTANNRIVITPLTGTITLVLTPTETAALAFVVPAVYDLELVSGAGKVTRLLSGTVALSPEVTR